jgi:hypothetical protein
MGAAASVEGEQQQGEGENPNVYTKPDCKSLSNRLLFSL